MSFYGKLANINISTTGFGIEAQLPSLITTSSSPYDPDAVIYFNNIAANGGSISTNSKNYINTFVLGMKAQGLWSMMAEIYPYMGDQLAAALVKLKYQNTPYLTNYNFVNSDYIETGSGAGLTGDAATKYLDTMFYADSSLINPYNSEIGVYTNKNVPYSFYGVRSSAIWFAFNFGGKNTAYYVGGGGYVDFEITTGLFGVRNNATNTDAILDGSLHSTNSNSPYDNTDHTSFYVFAINQGGPSFIGGPTMDFMYISQALTAGQETTLYSLIQALQTSLGRQV